MSEQSAELEHAKELEARSFSATPREIRDWFIMRFNKLPEQDPAYYQEWIQRFRKGTAVDRMDLESRKVYDKVSTVRMRYRMKRVS